MIQGEVCVAGSRVYVQEGIYEEFVKKAVEAAQSWKVGDPFDVTSNMGPQVRSLMIVAYSVSPSLHEYFGAMDGCQIRQLHVNDFLHLLG